MTNCKCQSKRELMALEPRAKNSLKQSHYSLLLFLMVVSYELELDVEDDMRDELQSRLLSLLSTSANVLLSDKISSCCSRTCRSKS